MADGGGGGRAGACADRNRYAPHRSTANSTQNARKLLYLTYNGQAEGYLRDEYYRHKRETIEKVAAALHAWVHLPARFFQLALCPLVATAL